MFCFFARKLGLLKHQPEDAVAANLWNAHKALVQSRLRLTVFLGCGIAALCFF
jgi:hypothetical protein